MANAGRQRVYVEPLSKRWFGVDFRDVLPWEIAGVSVEYATFEAVMPFVREHFAQTFGIDPDDKRWHTDPMTAAKRRFYAESDVFAYRDGGKTVGFLLANPTDWSSYYLRSMVVLPPYRRRGLLGAMSHRLAQLLGPRGVERIDTDVPPLNLPSLNATMKAGFVPRGNLNTDRWGAIVQLTKSVSDEADDVFRQQFCIGRWPRCRPQTSTGPEGRAT